MVTGKGRKQGSFNAGILELVNRETQKIDEDGTTQLQQDMYELEQRYGKDYPPVRDYRKLKEGASETVRSIVIMVNAQLRLLKSQKLSESLKEQTI